jgi:hypothetical protein
MCIKGQRSEQAGRERRTHTHTHTHRASFDSTKNRILMILERGAGNRRGSACGLENIPQTLLYAPLHPVNLLTVHTPAMPLAPGPLQGGSGAWRGGGGKGVLR